MKKSELRQIIREELLNEAPTFSEDGLSPQQVKKIQSEFSQFKKELANLESKLGEQWKAYGLGNNYNIIKDAKASWMSIWNGVSELGNVVKKIK